MHLKISYGQATPGRNMRPGRDLPQKEHGTRQSDRKRHRTETPPQKKQNDWQKGQKNITLPQTSFAGGNKGACPIQLADSFGWNAFSPSALK